MLGLREIIDMNLGSVESKRVSFVSFLEGEIISDEKRGIYYLVFSNLYLKKLFILIFFIILVRNLVLYFCGLKICILCMFFLLNVG